MATTQERLDEVQNAISTVVTGGEEVRINGRTVKAPSLEQLQELESYLQSKLNRESAGGIRVGQVVPFDRGRFR